MDHCWAVMWDLVRGAARAEGSRRRVDLARRYAELLVDNLGQPGFRELLITVHDLDAHRDLVFALCRRSTAPRSGQAADLRRTPTRAAAEVLDLPGVARDHLTDAIAASLAVPLGDRAAHDPICAPTRYWRGDAIACAIGPGSLLRLVEELALLDVEQIVLVSAAPDSPGPHALAPPRLDGRGRIGEYLQSFEAASVRDAHALAGRVRVRASSRAAGAQSDRPVRFRRRLRRSIRSRAAARPSCMTRGYEDAYHQFIEPVVGAKRRAACGVRERLMKPATESDSRRRAGSGGAVPLTTPIYETATFVFENPQEVVAYNEGRSSKYLYSRYAQPDASSAWSASWRRSIGPRRRWCSRRAWARPRRS